MDQNDKWVEIEIMVLPCESRTAKLPLDTSQVDLIARIKGFLLGEANVGDLVKIKTISGRELEGKLLAINPAYKATFGSPVPELIMIGRELREFLEDAGDKQP